MTGYDLDIKKEYPEIYSHLLGYKEKLQKREDQGKNWFNLRPCNYYEDFEKPKIIYPEITKFLTFYYDEKHFYGNNKVFIMTGESLAYLCCFFNSKLFDFCFRDNFPVLLGGSRELRKVFMEKIQIKKVAPKLEARFKELLGQISSLKSKNLPYKDIEREIDFALYKLNDITYKEAGLIDPSLEISEEEFIGLISKS